MLFIFCMIPFYVDGREKKLVSYMVASISPYDDDFKEYSFPVAEFADFFQITDKNVNKEYERIATGSDLCKRLSGQNVRLRVDRSLRHRMVSVFVSHPGSSHI